MEVIGAKVAIFKDNIHGPKNFPRLKRLTLRNCDDRVVDGFNHIARSLIDSSLHPDFQKFYIENCQLSEMQLFRLQHLHPRKVSVAYI